MIPKELMILAGGSGTRIRESIPGLPKALAPVGNKPFIDHLIRFYLDQGLERFVFCLGIYQDQVIDHLESAFPNLDRIYVCESEPLGTGGAIRNGLGHCISNTVLAVNGDTYYAIELAKASAFHHMCGAECTLLLKHLDNTERYGRVELGKDYRVTGFIEKGISGEGLINAGAYLLNKRMFLANDLPLKFSFEKEYLEKYFINNRIYGLKQDRFFLDIGIPEDLVKAQTDIIAYESRMDQPN